MTCLTQARKALRKRRMRRSLLQGFNEASKSRVALASVSLHTVAEVQGALREQSCCLLHLVLRLQLTTGCKSFGNTGAKQYKCVPRCTPHIISLNLPAAGTGKCAANQLAKAINISDKDLSNSWAQQSAELPQVCIRTAARRRNTRRNLRACLGCLLGLQ